MHALGIRTGAGLKRRSHLELVQQFGKVGSFYYKIARGEDERIVEPNRIRKSIGATKYLLKVGQPSNQATPTTTQIIQKHG
jgi:DNA polymerase-4